MRNIWLGGFFLMLLLVNSSGVTLGSDFPIKQRGPIDSLAILSPLSDDVVAHWPLDEGSGQYANDISGKNNNGKLKPSYPGNAPVWTSSGESGNALVFDGIDDWVDIGDRDALNPHLSDWSVSAWINTTSTYSRIFSKGSHGGSQPGYAIMIYPGAGGKAALVFGIGGHEHIIYSDNPVNNARWHMVTGVISRSSTIRLYIDGIQQTDTMDISDHSSIDLAADTYNATIGVSYCYYGIPNNLNEFFSGKIDDVRVWSRALSSTEVNNLYRMTGVVAHWSLDEGSGQYANDTSGYNNNGILGSTPGGDPNDPAWTTGISNSALSFNGKNFVTVPDNASLNPSFISVEAWVNPASYGYYRSFITKNYYGSGWYPPYFEYMLWLQDNTPNPSFVVTVGGVSAFAVSADAIPMNQWSFLAGTYNGTNLKIYVNGILKGTASSPSPGTPIDSRPYPLYIGVSPNSNHYYYGKTDEVSIWNRALTSEEILKHYNSGVGAPVHNLNTNLYFNTIQEAIDDRDTLNGHTITVSAGTYNEHLTVNKRLTLIGHGSADTIVDGGGSGSVVNITSDWVNMTGFKVTGSGSNWEDAGISLNNVHHCRIENNNASSHAWMGILLISSSHNRITNNVASNDWTGIRLESLDDYNTISGNIVKSSSYGIYLYSSSHNLITDNTAEGDWIGILIQRSIGNIIANNTVKSNYGIDITDSSSYNNITNNNISLSSFMGIYLYSFSNYNNIISNNLYSNGYAIFLDSCNFNTVANNTAQSNSRGISLAYSDHNILFNNTANSSTYYAGIYLTKSSFNSIIANNLSSNYYGIHLEDSSNYNDLVDNNASKNGFGIYLLRSDYNNLTGHNASLSKNSGILLRDSTGNNITYNRVFGNKNPSNIGIYLTDASNNNELFSNGFSSNAIGIYVSSSNNSQIISNNITGNTNSGVILFLSNASNLSHNRIIENEQGVGIDSSSSNIITYNWVAFQSSFAVNITASISSSSNNRIHHNEFISNNISGKQAWDEAGGNYWNHTQMGNHWSDYDESAEGCNDDLPADGICDLPYMIPGGAGARDYYPSTLPVVYEVSSATFIILLVSVILGYITIQRRK